MGTVVADCIAKGARAGGMEDAEERDDLVMLKDVSACLYSGILSLLAVMLMVTYTLWASGFVEYKVYPLTTPVGTLVACMHPWTTTDWIITPTPLPGTGTSTRVTLHVGAFDLEPPQNAGSSPRALLSSSASASTDSARARPLPPSTPPQGMPTPPSPSRSPPFPSYNANPVNPFILRASNRDL